MQPEQNAELMKKAAEGDAEAFVFLYIKFIHALRSFFVKRGCNPDLCHDLVQKIFMDLWTKREDFRAQSSFETYLFAIAKNTLHKEMKRVSDATQKSRKNYRASPDQLWNGLSEPEAKLYLEEFREAIEKALSKLTPAQQLALDYYGDRNSLFPEDSAKPDTSDPAYRNRLKRARKHVRELLAPFLNDDDALRGFNKKNKQKKNR